MYNSFEVAIDHCCYPYRPDNINEIDGMCSSCGMPTIEGKAAYGCHYSPIECENCGSSPCNGSC